MQELFEVTPNRPWFRNGLLHHRPAHKWLTQRLYAPPFEDEPFLVTHDGQSTIVQPRDMGVKIEIKARPPQPNEARYRIALRPLFV